jgi:uncharacterized protein involved in cysteine biosynthesis
MAAVEKKRDFSTAAIHFFFLDFLAEKLERTSEPSELTTAQSYRKSSYNLE